MLFGRQTKFAQIVIVLVLLCVPLAAATASQDNVVPRAELHKDIAAAANSRQGNVDKLQAFFSSPAARRAHVDSRAMGSAVAQLSDEELARLASQAARAQADFAAGALTNQEITYILIALATAVIVLILVKS